jgi:hypothetical protein
MATFCYCPKSYAGYIKETSVELDKYPSLLPEYNRLTALIENSIFKGRAIVSATAPHLFHVIVLLTHKNKNYLNAHSEIFEKLRSQIESTRLRRIPKPEPVQKADDSIPDYMSNFVPWPENPPKRRTVF